MLARIGTYAQVEMHQRQVVTRRAELRRGEESMYQIQRTAGPGAFVGHLAAELAQPYIGDGLGERVILEHPVYIEVFEDAGGWPRRTGLGFRSDPSGRLLQRILAQARDPIVDACLPILGLLAVLASCLAIAVLPLRTLELLEVGFQRLGVGTDLSIGADRQCLDPQVHPHRFSSR